ncbi:hypothetical protein ElyMa_001612000 [Elysia marginata]|uniref:Uncharacterized protein n=1 Tax=Elysia marginata TaxID=1093978 RepID=A0AAV4JJ10_9GAST|nr:hypothetical protein ElyMa_001612000 [Elysia marginata]
MKKPLSQPQTRLQKLLMRARGYDYEFKWILGAHLSAAHYFSKDCPSVKVENDAENEVDCHLTENSTRLPDGQNKKMNPARLGIEFSDRDYFKWLAGQ